MNRKVVTFVLCVGLGFALQDRGALFSMDESAADVYVAGKRPFHTIMPGFVTRDDEPWLSFGVMGGNMQVLSATDCRRESTHFLSSLY